MTRRFQNKLCLVTLGCSKNQVDAEYALALWKDQGFTIVPEPDTADILVINTCAFIQPAEQEAVQAITEAAALKQRHGLKTLLVVGCLVAKYGAEKLKQLIPEIDYALPPAAVAEWVETLRLVAPRAGRKTVAKTPGQRVLLSGQGSAYLKIAEGCSRRCAYCLIPRLRGPLRSRSLESLLQETKQLVRGGIKELILVAQDTTQYGRDLGNKVTLALLLDQLVKIPQLAWIRIMYAYPEGLTPDLIQRVAREPKICKYLDLPLQHVERRILRAMGRPGDYHSSLLLVRKLRREIPGVALRTTLLSGFPGETEADHERMLAFIRAAGFDRLGVFAYSQEMGTRAAELKPQVPMATRKRRQRELMQAQVVISTQQLQNRVGSTVECLAEEPSGSRHFLARTVWDAPEVDGLIILEGCVKPGTLVKARVTGSTEHDLRGTLL